MGGGVQFEWNITRVVQVFPFILKCFFSDPPTRKHLRVRYSDTCLHTRTYCTGSKLQWVSERLFGVKLTLTKPHEYCPWIFSVIILIQFCIAYIIALTHTFLQSTVNNFLLLLSVPFLQHFTFSLQSFHHSAKKNVIVCKLHCRLNIFSCSCNTPSQAPKNRLKNVWWQNGLLVRHHHSTWEKFSVSSPKLLFHVAKYLQSGNCLKFARRKEGNFQAWIPKKMVSAGKCKSYWSLFCFCGGSFKSI